MKKSEIFSKKMHLDYVSFSFYDEFLPHIWKYYRDDWFSEEREVTAGEIEHCDMWKCYIINVFFFEFSFSWRIDREKFKIYLLEKSA